MNNEKTKSPHWSFLNRKVTAAIRFHWSKTWQICLIEKFSYTICSRPHSAGAMSSLFRGIQIGVTQLINPSNFDAEGLVVAIREFPKNVIVSLSIETRTKDKENEKKWLKGSSLLEVILFGEQRKNFLAIVGKGDLIKTVGTPKRSRYIDKDGKAQYATSLIVREWNLKAKAKLKKPADVKVEAAKAAA